jgi:hypothetical protein
MGKLWCWPHYFFLEKEIYANVGIVESRLFIFEKIDMCEGMDEDL